MANYDQSSPNTGTTLAAMDAASVRQLWQAGVDVHDQSSDFFRPMEGRGTGYIINTIDATSKGAGQKITFTTSSGFYREPKHGEELFDSPSDFETNNISSFNLQVDWMRNAYRSSERMEEVMGMRGDIASQTNVELGKWAGREKTWRLMMMFREKGQPSGHNEIFAGTAGNANALAKTDTLSMQDVITAGHQLKPRGGNPARVGKTADGQDILSYCVVATTDALSSLKNDSDYKTAVRDAGERGDTNYIFKGGYAHVDGHFIKEYNPIDHDGNGPIGSPLNVKADLGVAVTAGTATFMIKGGGTAAAAADTNTKPFRFFKDYDYKFIEGDSLGAGTASFYVAIINPAGDADAGKFGFYKVNANDGNNLTVESRLGSANGGIRATAVGGLTWSASVNTDAHPVGSLVVYTNEDAVPLGHTLVLGNNAAYRGYGKYRNKRMMDQSEGGFIKSVYLATVFGQTPRLDRRDRAQGYLMITHALDYPGWPISPNLT